ncbi:hypothetical protein HPP92_004404 [Vanilla planifolia]|uniref:Amino acid transporter transmembrane domain-containing protein n=1 Tax=Vanilla planifolia TaxID=51239 RepID=A0A835S9C6_VANPL|nr:hypothetical protein HPP92_004404 [Vanilla planifolia]
MFSKYLWHGGSVYDAWFSCASNQVAQVLLTLPYSFSQLGMASGIIFQLFYGLMGSWTAYLISVLYVEYRTRKEREKVDFRNHVIQWFEVLDGLLGKHWRNIGLFFNCTFLLFGSVIQLIACASNIYYINDKLDKRTWTYIFGACCATTVFIPSFHNYRVWSFLGLAMTTYTAWYLAIASLLHGQVEGVQHAGPAKMVLYFTGATNILYTFGGHAVTVEIMDAMWKPQKFKLVYLVATIYVLTLTLPSASAVYWAFGDTLLDHSNALSLLPRTRFRDTAVVLMLIHQAIHHLRICMHAVVLRVGEADRRARNRELDEEGTGQGGCGDPDLVPCHRVPLLRAHQLHGWIFARQLHRLHNSFPCSHGYLRSCFSQRWVFFSAMCDPLEIR